jgi:hypothetical protein
MRYFLNTVKSPDVVKGIYTRRKTSMKTEDLVVYEGGKG